MKKLLSYILTAALILTVMAPLYVLAAQEAKPDSPPAVTAPFPEAGIPLWEEWGFESLEEFLEMSGMTEEEYYEYELEQREWQKRYEEESKVWEEEQKARRQKRLEDMGGTPGITNVMVNGSFIKFPGAAPESSGGVTFVPARPLFEAFGAEMSYDPQTRLITASLHDCSVALSSGRDTMTVTKDGEDSIIEIAAPYVKGGATYLPVRAVAGALGYEVLWDSRFYTVVLIDTERLVAEIDKDFTIINSLLEMPVNQFGNDGGTYRTVLNLLVSITQLDSLDGDKSYKIGADVTIISDGKNFSLSGKIDLSDFLALLFGDMSYYMDEEDMAEMDRMMKMLMNITAEIIFNYDEGVLYIKSPLFSELLEDFPANAWLSIGGLDEILEEFSLDSITGELGFESLLGGTSVGGIINAEEELSRYYEPIYLYRNIMDSAKTAKAYLGDDKITQKGGDYTLKLTLDDIEAMAEDDDYYYYYPRYTAFDLQVTVNTKDGEITGASGKFLIREYYYSLTQYKCEFNIKPEKISFSLEIHEKNNSKTLITLDVSTAASRLPIPKGPPEGATIIDIGDIIGSGFGPAPDDIAQLLGAS